MTSDRALFEKHASIEAIQAAMDRAYAAERTAQAEIKWLTGLLLERSAQIRNGLWPAVTT